ncbi:MAG: spore coat U domain-containing protein [Qipengyuania sp.]|jgi:spore coat protein U-like protein|nr:spore coat U domain-containing protein [Qipengyuania sp.]
MSGTRLILAIVAAALMAAPVAVSANTLTGTMNARMRVDTSCRITTEPLFFGNVNIFSGVVDATANIRLRCGPAVAYSVAIDNGQNPNGTQRRLWNGGGWFQYVNYQIYRNAARTQVWGSTAGNVVTGTTPANGQVTLVAYGRVPNSIVMPNEYRDVVTVTVTF